MPKECFEGGECHIGSARDFGVWVQVSVSVLRRVICVCRFDIDQVGQVLWSFQDV